MAIVTVEKLENADKDADSLEKFVEGGRTEVVKTRKNKQYPTLQNAVYQVIETGGFEPFATEALLLASTPTLTKKAAKALDTKKVWLWDGTQWNDTGSSEYDLAKEFTDTAIKEYIASSLGKYEFCTKDGFKQAEIGHNFLSLLTVDMQMTALSKYIEYISKDGFDLNDSVSAFDAIRTTSNAIQFISKDGFELKLQCAGSSDVDTNELKKYINEKLAELRPVVIDTSQPLFTDVLVGFDDQDIEISVDCLIAQRDLQQQQRTVVASIAADKLAYFKKSSEKLTIQANKINGSAKLYLRDINSYNYTSLDLTVKSVPRTGLSGSPKILMIGDSITNRGGAAIVDAVLRNTGLTPKFIGTMIGSGVDGDNLDTTGNLNEGREGWRTHQFTNETTSKKPVLTGDEATYMAMTKLQQLNYNPFIRAAKDSDDASVVRNGYIFDPEFYCSRFSIDTPDIVFIQLGTNDIVHNESTAETTIYDNLLLIMTQIRSAFPDAKIIVSAVGRASADASGDAVLSATYPKTYRSTQRAINSLNDDKAYFCPSFAISDMMSGFPVRATNIDSISGAITGQHSDSLHPVLSGRQTLYTNIAAYIAAASINLI